MKTCGLLGRKLGHSYSPEIHALLGDYSYTLYEKEPEELEQFLLEGDFQGLNVTIPYKKAVLPFCRELSDTARRLGAVNTLVRRPDGTLWGGNTDYDGFSCLLRRSGLEVSGKECLVLGSGGASATAVAVLEDAGARVCVISRRGPENYENLSRHAGAYLIVNATPVGMYPACGVSPVDLSLFPHLAGVLDMIYNPLETTLLQQARARGIVAMGGLMMLLSQAAASAAAFTGRPVSADLAHVWEAVRAKRMNLVLIGMPGCGKTTLATHLARLLDRPMVDTDTQVEALAGMSIPEIFRTRGESGFRALETQVLTQVCARSGLVIATGGGCVTRPENLPLLRQNGCVVWLLRDAALLPAEGRPLSQNGDLARMERERTPLYRRACHLWAANDREPEAVAEEIAARFTALCARGYRPKILVLNGPNLNLLGQREPDIYGLHTYRDLEALLHRAGDALQADVDVFQTNHEGVLVDKIQAASGVYDGIILNPAAYTHTSVAILDALKATAIPTVEVHISDVDSREPFRRISYPGMACIHTVKGQGLAGYRTALEYLLSYLAPLARI